jgi:hypothetical protein
MKQRIALVAVSALTAGVLTVTSAPTASAANNAAWGGTNATTAGGVMNIATETAATAAGTTAFNDQKSEGLIANSTAVNTTATAVMRADGKIVVYLTGVTDGGSTINLPSGATFVTGTDCDKTKSTVTSGTSTRFVCVDDSAALKAIAYIQPSSSTTSFTIDYYQKADVTAVDNGSTEAAAVTTLAAAAVADLGTLTSRITVTVITTNAFSDFTSATSCATTDSAGAATTTGYAVSSAVVPLGSTMVVKSSKAADVLTVSPGLLITTATNTITSSGQSVPLTNENSSSATVTASAVGSYTMTLKASGGTSTTDTIYVTVVASCALNTFSLANSKVELQSPTYSAANSLVDEVPGTTNGVTLHLATILNNSYGSALSSGTWVATVTGGAVIGINLGNAAATPTAASVAAATGTGAYVNVAVSQGANLENKPWAGTITISYNGTTLVTKNAAITGDIATVKVSDPVIAKTGGSTYRTFTTNAYDSAGNRVAATLIPTATTMGSVVQNLIFTNATSATADTVTGNGVTCGATAGSAVVTAQTTNAAGATITSNTWTQTCAGSLYSYKASLDKATYNPGEVAVLTIEGLDSKGNLVFGPGAEAAADALVTTTGTGRINLLGATTATLASLAGTSLTVVTAPATTDAFVNGKAVYRFVVGSTAGSYTLAVNLPAVTTGTAQTVAYKINSDGSVSNADVLKSIVALIASINKQIQALQKLILKR